MSVVSSPYSANTGLSVSVVVYRPDVPTLERTLVSLGDACDVLRRTRTGQSLNLYLIDNGNAPDLSASFDALSARGIHCTLISGHGNVGYGRGHNLAIERVESGYHLILNPDVDLEPDALVIALDFLDAHPEAGLLTPRVGDGTGNLQYLCRRFPTVLDLFVRGFLPRAWRTLFASRLAHYEMQDLINSRDIVWDPPIVSGCFMLFRSSVLHQLGGFDMRYFLYFEDYDLSLRTHEVARIVYDPAVHVRHHGGGASRKGAVHIRLFTVSSFRFFNRFGWKLL